MLHIDGKFVPWETLELGTGDAIEDNKQFPDIFCTTIKYGKILLDRTNLIVGSKGTGKTHLMLNLKDEFESKENGYRVTTILEDESFKIQDLLFQYASQNYALSVQGFS